MGGTSDWETLIYIWTGKHEKKPPSHTALSPLSTYNHLIGGCAFPMSLTFTLISI